jgi:hypothetical protein
LASQLSSGLGEEWLIGSTHRIGIFADSTDLEKPEP